MQSGPDGVEHGVRAGKDIVVPDEGDCRITA
jgi:hypothetical protein